MRSSRKEKLLVVLAGTMEAVMPLGAPLTCRLTAPVHPVRNTPMLAEEDPPRVTVNWAGALSASDTAGAAATISAKGTSCSRTPLAVPTMNRS
jgi:hypothetical protein